MSGLFSRQVYWTSCHIARVLLEQLVIGDVEGLQNVPRRGACILASNHSSHFDPPLVGVKLPRNLTFFARKSLWKGGFANWWLDSVGTIPVDRDGDSDIKAMKSTLLALRMGGLLTLFPEGTRSRDGVLQKARPGIGLIAAKSQATVVPCRIFNSHRVLPRNSLFPDLRTRVDIVYGRPLPPSAYDPGREAGKERYQIIADRIMAEIAKLKRPRALAV